MTKNNIQLFLWKLWESIKTILAYIVGGKSTDITSQQSFTETDKIPDTVSAKLVNPEYEPNPIINKNDNLRKSAIDVNIITPQVINTPKSKEDQFIQSLKIVVSDGFLPLIVYVQAYLETGNFNHLVGDYNYFGMKPPRFWTGKTVFLTTHETINGITRKVKDFFCDFSSSDECILFYMYQIKRLYKEAYKNRNDYKLYYWWLTRDKFKWATDESYSEKLIKLYEDFMARGFKL